jgi:phosphatidylglycerol lysyltransferase
VDFQPDTQFGHREQKLMITAEKSVMPADALLLNGGLPRAEAPAAEKAGRRFRPALSIVVLAWAVRLVSLFNMLNALVRYEPKFIFWLGKMVPLQVTEGMRIRMFLMSVLLFVLASALQRGKKLAWQITLVGLLLAPMLHLDRGVIWPQALANLLLVGFLLYHHRYFVVESDPRSIRSALIVCPLLGAALLIFGAIRLHALHKHTVGDHSWFACAKTACELVFLHHTGTQLPVTQHARDLYTTLRLGGTGVAVVGLVLILRPVLLRRRTHADQWEKTRRLIALYGTDPLDPYALLDDKQYYFAENGHAVVPYVLSGNLAIALADPIGGPGDKALAISEFVVFCRHRDWEPVFYEVSDECAVDYERAGLCVFKIGEEARLRTDTFSLKGGDFQNLRTACNSARKRGITFRWYDSAFGVDEALERDLAEISSEWLKGKNAHEMAFDMGAFSTESIRKQGVALALDAEGRALAFATWRPFARGRGRSLDLMRSRADVRNVMDFVLVESILYFRDQGVHDISLGNAPLANADKDSSPPQAEDKAVQFLFENLNRIYGYKSLFEFKRKYRPRWRGRYVAYNRGVHLPLVGLALVRVHAPGGIWKFLRA